MFPEPTRFIKEMDREVVIYTNKLKTHHVFQLLVVNWPHKNIGLQWATSYTYKTTATINIIVGINQHRQHEHANTISFYTLS